MNPHQSFRILPFQPENQAEVKALILAGLSEHWGTLDPQKNPDLNDIAQTYKNAVFLLAWQGDKIIGTGALVHRSADTAEIVRMSVAAGWRRNGIGREILQNLREHAAADGYKRLVLETTATWQEVIRFYEHFGFYATHHLDGDIYFVLDV